MFGMPVATSYDVKFRLLGIPVRVNPFFWALAAYLGWESHDRAAELAVWMVAVFVSILVHEYGHGLTARYLAGQRPSIVLYQMGGLCFYDQEVRSPWRRLGVILMGPLAGLTLYALVTALAAAVLGFVFNPLTFLPVELARSLGLGPANLILALHSPPSWLVANQTLAEGVFRAYYDLSVINFYWSLFNLLPIYPLDGGQMTMTLLTMRDRAQGARNCHIVSIGVAAIIAVYFVQRNEIFNAILVGSFALLNFQALQMISLRSRYSGGFEDEDQWWRR